MAFKIEHLRKFRNEKGLSQEFIANYIGIGQSTYQKIEAGEVKITMDRLIQIAEVLEKPISNFLSDEQKNIENQDHSNNQDIHGVVINIPKKQVELMEKIISLKEQRIRELEEKIKRRDLKIQELKQLIGSA